MASTTMLPCALTYKQKALALLSIIHDDDAISGLTEKSEIIEFYNISEEWIP